MTRLRTAYTMERLFRDLDLGRLRSVDVSHKYGRRDVGTTHETVTFGGDYQMPQTAVALRVAAGNAGDAFDGAGAREITVEGLDETGRLTRVALATAGASAGGFSSTTFIRAFRAWVSKSGTYANAVAGSQLAGVVVESATETWLTLGLDRSQTEAAAYTVPLGKKAFLASLTMTVDSTKAADVLLFTRSGILDTTPPYQALRLLYGETGLSGPFELTPVTLAGPIPELTDIFFMAKVGTGTGTVACDIEIVLVDGL